jgi:hypothetical protein
MEAIYRLNTRDMGIGFVNSVQAAYPDRDIEIVVRESDDPDFDETEYLMRPPNGEHLLKAIKEEKIITFESVEEASKCAEEWAAKQ